MSSRKHIEPRLLSRKQAAAYCGMCAATFDRYCPVVPVALDIKNHRFDRHDLDRWIDQLGKGQSFGKDWLAALDDDGNAHANKGH